MQPTTGPINIATARVLLTGVGGFLGSHLAERLADLGANIVGVSRLRGNLDLLPTGICEFISCDLRNREAVSQVCKNFRPDIVYHLASQSDGQEGYTQSQACLEGNLTATLNLLDAACEVGTSAFVYGDSSKVYGNCDVPFRESTPMRPLSSYAITKAAGWEYCLLYARRFGTPVVSIRPTMIYGPRQSFNLITYVTESVKAGRKEIRLDGGTQTRDPLFIHDAIEVFVRAGASAAQLAGRVVNIGGGYEITVADLTCEVLRVSGSHLPIVCDSSRRRLTETQRSYCDNAEAQALLRWAPHTSLLDGLQSTVQFLTTTRVMQHAASK
jgi:nucleoside-diphosphate-sugar epimerase